MKYLIEFRVPNSNDLDYFNSDLHNRFIYRFQKTIKNNFVNFVWTSSISIRKSLKVPFKKNTRVTIRSVITDTVTCLSPHAQDKSVSHIKNMD